MMTDKELKRRRRIEKQMEDEVEAWAMSRPPLTEAEKARQAEVDARARRAVEEALRRAFGGGAK